MSCLSLVSSLGSLPLVWSASRMLFCRRRYLLIWVVAVSGGRGLMFICTFSHNP